MKVAGEFSNAVQIVKIAGRETNQGGGHGGKHKLSHMALLDSDSTQASASLFHGILLHQLAGCEA